MKDLKVNCNLGVGDAIIMAPYINFLSQDHLVTIPSYEHNKESVKSFFNENVNVISYDPTIKWDIHIGHTGDLTKKSELNFIDWFYDQVGGTREEFLKFSPLEEAAKKVEQLSPVDFDYDFIHQDFNRRFYLTKYDIKRHYIQPGNLGSILIYAEIIKNAKEIHCIDSAFLHLCEQLPTTGKLYYHQYARPYSTTDYRFIKDWEVIK